MPQKRDLSPEREKALQARKKNIETSIVRMQNKLNELTAEYDYVREELGLPPASG
jgi:prefoldin subunit 5